MIALLRNAVKALPLASSVAGGLVGIMHALRSHWNVPPAAKAERKKDRQGLPGEDPGIARVVPESVAWLARAQDCSLSRDGGVARHYSLLTGWGPSYPETTGYIVPTLLDYAQLTGDSALRDRARRMLDWLVSIQFPDGGFQGGTIDAKPRVPVAFNTGQILLGLARGVREFGDGYRKPMVRAADWLVKAQDADGCWRKYSSPFALPGETTYDTHIAWGLLEAAGVEPGKGYAEAALANVRWALGLQQENGWFARCALLEEGLSRPLTHTIGYALRGVLEAYRFSQDASLLNACRKTADGLLSAMQADGFLPGHLDRNWRGTVKWSCLTGTVQIALCWLLLYQITGDARYRDAAYAANRFVRRTVRLDGPQETRGGVKGSFPVHGSYGAYEYPNWACKFLIDSHLLEKQVRAAETKP